MILSAQSIRKRQLITPFCERSRFNGMTYGLSAAGYDVRIAETTVVPMNGARLAATLEYFNMPNDLLGRVADKSTLARMFIAVQNTIIEPGWRGYLTLEITNHSYDDVRIPAGSPIAQIIFELLDFPTEHPYEGRYQDQAAGATAAKLIEDGDGGPF